MDDSNAAKENIKAKAEGLKFKKLLTVQKDEQLQSANQKIKTIAAKAVQAFQLTEEYNIFLFSWYYKGFKLLRRYLVKHDLEVDLENLDFESIDKEMDANEAAQTVAMNDENPAEPEGEALRHNKGEVLDA